MPGDSPPPPNTEPIGPAAEANQPQISLWYTLQVKWLRMFVLGLLRDADLVNDVIQTVFRKATEHYDQIDPGSVRAWLTKVAHNEAMLLLRKQGVHSRAVRLLQERDSLGADSDPLEGLIQRESAERLRQALLRLPAMQRDVVERRIDHDQTFAEIATALDVPLGTVLTRMRLALTRLRNELGTAEE